jgi:hypothetical protein
MAPSAQKVHQGHGTPRTEKAIVARGRCIDVPHATQRETVGFGADGKPIKRAVTKQFVAGDEVELPVDDIARLRMLGYLIYPDQSAPPIAIESAETV